MILFDFIITLIEDFTLSFFNYTILDIPHKRRTVIITIIISLIGTYVFNNLILNNFWLLVYLLLVYTGTSIYITKELNLYYFIVPSILIAILLLSNTVSLIIISSFFKVNPIDIGGNNLYIIYLSLLSRVVYILFSLVFNLFEKKLEFNQNYILKSNYWLSFCIFTLSFLGVFTSLYELIFYNLIDTIAIYKLLIQFIIMISSFFVFYVNIQREYQNNLEISSELIKSHYANETYKRINKLSYQMLQEKHMILYILLKIKNLNLENNKEEIERYINENLDKFKTYDFSHTTNNSLFDHYILNYINLLKAEGYIIKEIIAIQSDRLLGNKEIIKIIELAIRKVADYSASSKEFDIQLYDSNMYLIMKIVTKKADKELILSFDCSSKYIRKKEIVSHENGEVELKVLFKDE